MPESFTCEIRAEEFGLFRAWSDCEGNGLTLTYSSSILNAEGECVASDTDKSLAPSGTAIQSADFCNLVIKATSSDTATECMRLKSFATLEANKLKIGLIATFLLLLL